MKVAIVATVLVLVAMASARPEEKVKEEPLKVKVDAPLKEEKKTEQPIKEKEVPKETYTTKYDNIDLDEILKSDRLLENYFSCVMERGKCSPDGVELKSAIPDALLNACSKCSEKQQEGTRRVIKFLAKNKRPLFDELIAKYDSEGLYKKRYADELAKEGIVL